MASNVNNMIENLEDCHVGDKSKKIRLQTPDGSLTHLDRSLCNASSVLRNHSASEEPLKVSADLAAVESLLEAHRTGNLPEAHDKLINLLAVSKELGLESIQRSCILNLTKHQQSGCFLSKPHPKSCSNDAVLSLFETICSTPLRTQEIYNNELRKILEHANSQEVPPKALRILKLKLEPYSELLLEGIPLDFTVTNIPIAIAEKNGKSSSMIFDGAFWKPVNIFGMYFDSKLTGVCNFYLNYGKYILYLDSTGKVFRKKLTKNDKPEMILDKCKQLLVRENSVFVVIQTEEKSTSEIRQWDNEEFKFVYSNTITSNIDYSPKRKMLAYCEANSEVVILQLEGLKYHVVQRKPSAALEKIQFYVDILYGLANKHSTWQEIVTFNAQALNMNYSPIGDIQQIAGRLFSKRSSGVHLNDDSIVCLSELPLYS